jgi:hypothetical protein
LTGASYPALEFIRINNQALVEEIESSRNTFECLSVRATAPSTRIVMSVSVPSNSSLYATWYHVVAVICPTAVSVCARTVDLCYKSADTLPLLFTSKSSTFSPFATLYVPVSLENSV